MKVEIRDRQLSDDIGVQIAQSRCGTRMNPIMPTGDRAVEVIPVKAGLLRTLQAYALIEIGENSVEFGYVASTKLALPMCSALPLDLVIKMSPTAKRRREASGGGIDRMAGFEILQPPSNV